MSRFSSKIVVVLVCTVLLIVLGRWSTNRLLIEAAENGNAAVVEALLWLGADPNYQYWVDNCAGHSGTPLYIAAANKDFQTAEILLNNGADIDYSSDGWRAITYAAWKGNLDVVKFLLDKGAKIDNMPPTIHYAISHKDVFFYLIDKGADINAVDDYGRTVFMDAASQQEIEIMEILLEEGVDVNHRDKEGNTALLLLSRRIAIDSDALDLLLKNGADIRAKDSQGMNVLISALRTGHDNPETIKLLVGRGADVNAQCNSGWTALMWAAKFGALKSAKVLVDNGCDIAARNNDGETALGIATRRKHASIIALLDKHRKYKMN